MSTIKVGLVGRRGGAFVQALKAIPEAELVAMCDLDENVLRMAVERYGVRRTYTDYEAFLDSDIDAVVVATPMPLHVPQSVAALKAGKHVLSEVPAAVSLEECWQLLETVEETGRTYMMAENYCYIRTNVLVRELVRRGFFGEVYFGVGEYIHELKELNERTPWRRVWQTGRNGNTYPTHSLGPLLQWLDDRVETVCCLGSGHHYRDPRGARYENEDTTITLGKLSRGGLVQLRLDMLSNRPHAMAYYALQGTKGCYEAPRAFRGVEETHKVWFADYCDGPQDWRPLSDFEEYLPERYKNPPEEALKAGHWGGDYWEVRDFIDAILTGEPPEIDVVTAVEWTAVGLCSIESISRGGAPVDVPDFRARFSVPRKGEAAQA